MALLKSVYFNLFFHILKRTRKTWRNKNETQKNCYLNSGVENRKKIPSVLAYAVRLS